MTTGDCFVVDMGRDFSQFPAGRTGKDGDFNGTAFRDRYLLPHLQKKERTVVRLDSGYAYGSSFLEEAFGGLVRAGLNKALIAEYLELDTRDEALKREIRRYVEQAAVLK